MKLFIKIIATLTALLPFPLNADAEIFRPSDSFLREDVVFLSDSLRQGRAMGTRGNQDAVFYIVSRFLRQGLETRVQSFSANGKVGHNVLGYYRGDTASDKYYLIMAYFDGLGTYEDSFYPGADTNASGVAAMLELSRMLYGCDKNIVFAAIDGHNNDMSGAEAFAASSGNICMVINLDTIGSTLAPPDVKRADYLIALGGDQFVRPLFKVNLSYCLKLYLDYFGSSTFADYFYRKLGDQSVFLSRKVPSVMFTSGITLNTFKVTDTPSELNYEILAKRVNFIGSFLMAL